MKILFSIAIAAFFCFSNAFGQIDTVSYNNYPMMIGPYISTKAGVNAAEVPEGLKNGVAFNGIPDFGIIYYQPLSSQNRIGLLLELAYSTYAFVLKPWTAANNDDWVQKLHYGTLGAEFYLYGFTIGLNTGINFSSSSSDIDMIQDDNLGAMVELRIGGEIPVYYSRQGLLNLMIRGGYFLSGAYKDDYNSGYNLHPASVEIGMNYLFNINRRK